VADFIVLIHSNSNGDPTPGSSLGHWVRVTDNPHPAAVNQLAAGGQHPHADCGEACVKSILKDRGRDDPIVEIEHEEGAGPYGTNATQLERSLAEDFIGSHTVGNYPNGHPVIMNPLGGRVVTGQEAEYIAAFWGQTIVVADSPTPVPPRPTPHPPAPNPRGPFRTRCVVVTRPSWGYRSRQTLHVRSGPGLHFGAVTAIGDGVRLNVDEFYYGTDTIPDPRNHNLPDNRWYHYNRGWVASALVDGDAPGSKRIGP